MVEIAVRFEIPAPLGYPVKIALNVPEQARVVTSELDAPIAATDKGSLVRRLVLRTTGPLSLEKPLIVTADGQTANGAMGLHAERQVPAKPEQRVVPTTAAPPGGRPRGAAAR